ncbi:MAG TPA: hypothetical protein PKZ03_07320, partial [Methanothrix sp.]|nr:hypothetical protein [Methanothrix sp.]
GSDIKKRPYTGWNSGEKGGESGPCSQPREQYPALLSCASVDKSWTSPQRAQRRFSAVQCHVIWR